MTDPINATLSDPSFLHALSAAAFAGLLVWAAMCDVARLRIPNSACLAIVGLFPVFAATAPGGFPWLLAGVISAALLILGLIAFSHGLMGGGDVKLMSAVALWAGPERVLDFLFATALAGGALAVLMTAWLRFALLDHGPMIGRKLPYGVAIGIGAALAVFVPFAV